MFDDTHKQAGDKVDRHNHDGCDRVAAYKLTDTIHCSVKVRLTSEVASPSARFLLADTTGIEVRVDCHLLAGHRVESEARCDFGDAAGALGHNGEVDDGEDHEDHHSNRIVIAHNHAPKCFNYRARRTRTEIAMQQNEPGRSDIERESQKRGDKHHGRKG